MAGVPERDPFGMDDLYPARSEAEQLRDRREALAIRYAELLLELRKVEAEMDALADLERLSR